MAETLELKIKSDADQAAKSIDNLGNKLRSLGDTLSSISGSNIGNFSSSLNELATSIKGLGNIDTRTFSKVAQNIQKISNVDSAKLVNSATALGDMSKQLSSFAGLAKQSQDITTLIQSISKLGGKSATNAASNIRQLGSALKDVMTTLSKAPKISQNVIQMTNALANLASQGSKVGSASRSLTTGFTSITKSAKSTSGGFKGLASAFGKFYATYWMLIRAFGKIGDAVDLSSQLTEVQNVVDTTFGDMTYKVDEFTQRSIQDFGMSELTAKQIASRYQAMGTAVGITSSQVASGTDLINKKLAEQKDTLYATSDSLADMSLNLTRLAADMASFYDVDQEDVAKSLQSIFTGTTAPLRRYGIDLTQATLKEWANKQGIDANIKSMTQAEKVLLRYQYVMSQTAAAQGDFAKTADTWANSVRTLKQEFEAWGSIIGSTIINAFKPVVKFLNQVMLKVINFTRTVADALGSIFGWTIEISGAGIADDTEDVAGSVGDIGSSADSANASAKKLKKTLLSIDEIHALDSNDSSSGSGSGSGSGASGGGADTSLKKVDGLVEKYKSSIKDLYELGSYIGETITDSLNSIDWVSVYQGAKDFGKGLARFLNGLISPRLFGGVGTTIASALNTAIYSALAFGENFNWTNLGESIASGVNNFFDTFDFKAFGKTVNTWVQGIKRTIKSTIKKTNWKGIWDGLKDFISELDVDTVTIIIGAFALKYAGKLLTSTILKNAISSKLTTMLGLESGIAGAGQALTAGFAIGATVYVSFKFAEDAKDWIQNIKDYGWEEGRRKSAEENKANPYRTDRAVTQEDGTGPFDEWLAKLKEWQANNRATRQTEDKEWQELADNLTEKVSSLWTNGISPWFTTEKWSELGENVRASLSGKWNEFTEWWQNTGIYNWWNNSVAPWFTKEKWQNLGTNVKEGIQTQWNEFTEWWQNTGIYKWWNEHVTPWFTKTKWREFGSNIKEGIQTKWNEFTEWWNNTSFAKWWSGVKEKFSKSSWSFNGIKEGLSSAWDSAIEAIKGTWNTFATWLNKKLTLNIDTSTTIGSAIKTALGTSKITLGSIPTFRTGGFPDGENGLFYANSTELVGKFSNGKTAVANNEQITEGIRRAVVDGMMEVMMASGNGNGNNAPVIENVFKVDSETLYTMTQKGKQIHEQRFNVVTEF